DWSGYALVYVFQRPESMAHAAAKARHEMRPGSWLVSLEFKAPGLRLHAVLQREDARPVWVYAIGPAPRRG
ncbi:MAG TPA: methyltransferase type 12, partial [Zoogloea sp.]|nr:methyltransferase type 12 [Zoogloea sp.]